MRQGSTEYYDGTIAKFGADVGYLSSSVMMWSVVVPAGDLTSGSLAGHYAPIGGSATEGINGDVNVMTGGFENSIQLRPLLVDSANGLNVAVAVEAMNLKYLSNNGLKSHH